MSLSFPNQTSFDDATLGAVRFWGHDGAIGVAFFVQWAPHLRLCSTVTFAAVAIQGFEQRGEGAAELTRMG